MYFRHRSEIRICYQLSGVPTYRVKKGKNLLQCQSSRLGGASEASAQSLNFTTERSPGGCVSHNLRQHHETEMTTRSRRTVPCRHGHSCLNDRWNLTVRLTTCRYRSPSICLVLVTQTPGTFRAIFVWHQDKFLILHHPEATEFPVARLQTASRQCREHSLGETHFVEGISNGWKI